ncbi:MAG TPA: hypothetical protein VGB64_01420 [Actinomycetota bacterium]
MDAPGVPAPSQNGHRGANRAPLRDERSLRGVTAGVLVSALAAALAIPRILLLNLALFNPWPRPVVVAAAAGLTTGAFRRGGSARAAAISGAAAAALGLLVAYAGVRLSVRVLWVDRNPARVIAADALRLIAYAAVPGALGGLAGRGLRGSGRRARNRRALAKPPIERL